MPAIQEKTRNLTLSAVFVAIVLLMGLVPALGFIPIGALHIVTVHIPVIIGGVVLGPRIGGILGFFFGFTSLLNATFLQPNPIESPLFSPFFTGGVFPGNAWSLVICFVPRILVGVVAGLLFRALSKTKLPGTLSLVFCGVLSSLTNTVLVLGGIYVFFGTPYAAANDLSLSGLFSVILGIVSFNGLIEAAVAGALTAAVAKTLLAVRRRLSR